MARICRDVAPPVGSICKDRDGKVLTPGSVVTVNYDTEGINYTIGRIEYWGFRTEQEKQIYAEPGWMVDLRQNGMDFDNADDLILIKPSDIPYDHASVMMSRVGVAEEQSKLFVNLANQMLREEVEAILHFYEPKMEIIRAEALAQTRQRKLQLLKHTR